MERMSSAMSRLTIFKSRTAQDLHNPEFRALLDRIRVIAGEIYPEVVLHVVEEEGGTTPGPSDLPEVGHVLLLGRRNALLEETSLRLLAKRLGDGVDAVLPAPLETFDLLQERAVFTLRGFERIEAEILEQGLRPRTEPTSLLPVSLLTAEALRRLVGDRPLGELLAAGSLPADGLRVERGGIYHMFIDYYGEERSDVLSLVPAGARDVLEVGCGRGTTAALLASERGCRVVGVELNPKVAEVARQKMDRVLCGDVEDLDLADAGGPFDVCMALEVIEHLTSPQRFLAKLREVTRPGGRIVLSTPNVGHHSVVEDLLAGRWDYTPMGVLCSTHLRFFTRHTLEDLLWTCGFERFEIQGHETELPERWQHLDVPFEVDRESLKINDFLITIDL